MEYKKAPLYKIGSSLVKSIIDTELFWSFIVAGIIVAVFIGLLYA